MAAFEETHARITKVLVGSLGVDADQVTHSATLQGDLGAESIDFLDIVFRLEREFGIKVPRGELFPDSIFEGHAESIQDGLVTNQGMAELRARMPYADLSEFDRDRRLGAVIELFTVGLLVRYVQWKLNQAGHDVSTIIRHSLASRG
jgi:acyl carrier protein